MANLYKYHSNPDYPEAFEVVPELVYEKYFKNPEELKKREHILAKDAKIAYLYADKVLNGRFELGEAAISKDGYWNEKYQGF